MSTQEMLSHNAASFEAFASANFFQQSATALAVAEGEGEARTDGKTVGFTPGAEGAIHCTTTARIAIATTAIMRVCSNESISYFEQKTRFYCLPLPPSAGRWLVRNSGWLLPSLPRNGGWLLPSLLTPFANSAAPHEKQGEQRKESNHQQIALGQSHFLPLHDDGVRRVGRIKNVIFAYNRLHPVRAFRQFGRKQAQNAGSQVENENAGLAAVSKAITALQFRLRKHAVVD